jgi:hypothetical protein
MHYKRISWFFFLFFSLIQTANATLPPIFASIDAALLFSSLGLTQDVNLVGSVGNRYVATNNNKTAATAIFGLGARTYENDWLVFNTSVRYIPFPQTELNGNVWQLKSPRFNNLAYTYKLQSDVFFAENIASWARHVFQPGLILGLGRASNKAGGYQATMLNNRAASALELFGNAKRVQLAYEVGAALDYSHKEVVVELAYRFIDLGQGKLQASSLQSTQDIFSTGPIRYQVLSLGARVYYDKAV